MPQAAATQDLEEIQTRIKQVISHVTNIPADSIANDASFKDDLQLDSLAMLEIAVDVDYEFKLGIQDLEDRIGELSSVQHVADLVATELSSRN